MPFGYIRPHPHAKSAQGYKRVRVKHFAWLLNRRAEAGFASVMSAMTNTPTDYVAGDCVARSRFEVTRLKTG